ncbi:MAG TPA: glycosyltransferase 87 family protein [Polyangia bacterium]
MRRAGVVLAALGIAVLALTWATVATSRSWPATFERHLLLYVCAGAAWAIALLLLPRLPRGRGQLGWVLVISVGLRLIAWRAPPAHSDDVYRYLWDGRVQRAGINPYRYPPAAPELASLRDANWARINNRDLPTVYPPAAELLFRVAAYLPLAPLVAWRLVVAGFDLGLVVLLMVWLGRRGGDPRRALAWGWSPLAAIELGQNAHADAAGIALLVAALVACELERRRGLLAGALLALSSLVKPLGAVLIVALRSRRAAIAFVLVALLCAAPYLGAGRALSGSAGEYGRRWRANDGAFALFYDASAALVGHTRFRARFAPASPRLARLITGRDRDQVYPDEAANFLARAAAFALFLLAVGLAIARRMTPLAVCEVTLGAFLLLTPALHPWYVLWILPLLAPGAIAGPAWLVLATLAPLGYLPLAAFRAGHPWHDPIWTRALEHGLSWLLIVLCLTRRRRPVISSDR